MKKSLLLGIVLLASVSLTGCDACKENALDRAGDWFATLGKEEVNKDQIVAERKADRAAACLEQKGKELQKSAEKTGEELKKKLGM